MLRIRFTLEDLARTRMVAGFGPYAETLFSLGVLRPRARAVTLFEGWRRKLGKMRAPWVNELTLAIGDPPVLDLFTVMGRASGDEEGAAALLGASRAVLRQEVEVARLAVTRRAGRIMPPTWLFRLPDDRATRADLLVALSDWHRTGIMPYWASIQRYLDAEVAALGEMMSTGGIGLVLATLHPRIRWNDGVLEVSEVYENASLDREVSLGGRGMLLVPSVFCRWSEVFTNLAEPDGQAVLFYPAIRDVADAFRLWVSPPERSTREGLSALLGVTRARALEIIDDGCSTTMLADRLGVSPATASHHATVLREAGLITTRRRGQSVHHTVSPLGRALIAGAL